MQKLKEWLDQDRFGSPLVFRMSSFDEVYDRNHPKNNERIVHAHLRHGSPLVHEGAHLADFIRFFTNGAEPVRVTAAGVKSKVEYPRPNYASALVELNNGDIAQLEAAWLYPQFFPGVIDVMGDKGVARLERATKSLIYRNGETEETVRMEQDWNAVCFQKQLEYFIQCLDRRLTPVPGAREGILSIRFTELMERSLLTGRPATGE